jgi:hypothetical protein
MRTTLRTLTLVVLSAWLGAGCQPAPAQKVGAAPPADELTGAWRAAIQFRDGAFASVHDLEFMLAFHADGTMTESSNYDAAPPVPPAYGSWRRTGPRGFAAHYEFYATKPPGRLDEIVKGGGWLPAGRGVLTETLTLADDGRSYRSTLRYEAFDPAGKPVAGGGTATGRGTRMGF